MFWVYVLISKKDNKFYTGYTNNLERRIREHNSGKDKSTKWRKPFELFYCEKFLTRKEAMSRERFLKDMRNKSFFEKLKNGEIN